VRQYTRSSCGSYEPDRHVAAPPYIHTSFSLGQVSDPGSPGDGTVYLRHSFLPVSASHPSRNPLVALSPPPIPEITTPLTTIGDPPMKASFDSANFWSQTCSPVFISR